MQSKNLLPKVADKYFVMIGDDRLREAVQFENVIREQAGHSGRPPVPYKTKC